MSRRRFDYDPDDINGNRKVGVLSLFAFAAIALTCAGVFFVKAEHLSPDTINPDGTFTSKLAATAFARRIPGESNVECAEQLGPLSRCDRWVVRTAHGRFPK